MLSEYQEYCHEKSIKGYAIIDVGNGCQYKIPYTDYERVLNIWLANDLKSSERIEFVTIHGNTINLIVSNIEEINWILPEYARMSTEYNRQLDLKDA